MNGSQKYIAALEPGMLVHHPQQPGWGLGQVLSCVGDRLTVTFENAGKVAIDTRHVRLLLELDT